MAKLETQRNNKDSRMLVWAWPAADQLAFYTSARNWAALLAAIVATASFYFGYRQTALQREISSEKDRRLADFQSASAERTAQLERQTAIATATGEATRGENLKLALKLEAERKERLEMEERIAPRRLSADQIAAMAAGFRQVQFPPNSELQVESAAAAEPYNLARSIVEALRQAGAPGGYRVNTVMIAEQQTGIIVSGMWAERIAEIIASAGLVVEARQTTVHMNMITVAEKPL